MPRFAVNATLTVDYFVEAEDEDDAERMVEDGHIGSPDNVYHVRIDEVQPLDGDSEGE